ncbi:ATP-binding cassette domain-containing protein [Clostridium hydrogenum]|uniref:ATP-binding cassette domain-containing protein n=1 Tax=Clostridium hydrogenum TaxID=2855764 RepID=UPI001F435890|nr:ABC transporter ATP-binding protein [Clostridium hydrogenum]
MKKSNSIFKIYDAVKPNRFHRLLIYISSIIISLYNYIIANCIQMLFQGKNEMNSHKIYLFVISIITVFLNAASYYIIKKVSVQNTLRVEKKFKDRLLLKMNTNYYLKVEALSDGEWMTIVDSDVNRVSCFYQRCVINAVTGIAGFCLAILFGIQVSCKLTIIIMVFSTISFFLPKIIEKQLMKNASEIQKLQEQIRQGILLTFNKLPLIKLSKAYDILQKKFSKQACIYSHEKFKQAKMTAFLSSLFSLITYVCMAAWIFIGVYFISIGSMKIGGLLGFITLSSSFNWPLYIAPIIQKESVQAQTSYNRITKFLLEEDNCNKCIFQKFKADENSDTIIKGYDLSFSYKLNYDSKEENLKAVLKYLDFDIHKNDKVLLEGDSGVGKTTLMKIILGLYHPLSGSIFFNMNSNSEQSFSYVPQCNNVFTGTIRENLIIANSKASDEDMKKALKKAAVLDFVESLDKGLDTKVGSGYRGLSGGQAQRICLARAFLSDSKIIMIDEGTSAIDPNNKRVILESLKEIDKTVILISHDYATQSIANKSILVGSKDIE